MTEVQSPFADVDDLLDASQPGATVHWLRLSTLGLGVFILMFIFGVRRTDVGSEAYSALTTFALLGFGVLLSITNTLGMRRVRVEQMRVAAIEEMVQLRQWPSAAAATQLLLSHSTISPIERAKALILHAMVLNRYHRFEDVVYLCDYLLDAIPLDDPTQHAVRLARATALLHEDDLLESDRAIAELRRTSRGMESPGLVLVEMYRDVKTGHPDEVIKAFDGHLASLTRYLGHRVADAWALVSRAHDLKGDAERARVAFGNATLLSPVGELLRRYPEIAPVAQKFAPTLAPAEVA